MRFAAWISAALMLSAVATPAMSQPLTADAGFGGAGLGECPTELR